jgi:protein TonB
MKWFFTLIFFVIALSSFGQKKPVPGPVEYDTIYTRPQVMASFPGGEQAWQRYVKKHLKYPRKAWWDEIESDVAVKLVIDKDGTISNAYHLTTSGYGFEQEAVRLVKNSGKWVPAMSNGKPVKSEGELTIRFRLK